MKGTVLRIPTPAKVALKYGFFASVLVVALLIGLFYIDKHPLLIPIIYDIRIFLLAVFTFFAIKEFRDYRNGGELHFWQGMLIGMLIAISLGFFAALAIVIFGMVEPEFLNSYLEIMLGQLQSSKEEIIQSVGEEAYQNTLENLPSTTITDLALDYYLKSVVIGLFLTIIISVILRRKITA